MSRSALGIGWQCDEEAEMKGYWQLLSVGLLAGLTVLTVAADAKADPIGNPGSFRFTVVPPSPSSFVFPAGQVMLLHDFTVGNYFSADVDKDGLMHDFASNFPVATFVDAAGKQITVQLEFLSISTGGVVGSGTHRYLDFSDLISRIRFTYDGSPPCTTADFNTTMATRNFGGGVLKCKEGYNATTGEFCASGSDFTIPELPADECNGHGNEINKEFQLGSARPAPYMEILGRTSPIFVD
jgi:hypothetical protein